MTVQETSIKAYYDSASQRVFATQREFIYYVVENAKHPSLSDVARMTNIKINAVTGRMNELEKQGRIHKAGQKKDPFTGQTVNYYEPGDGKQ